MELNKELKTNKMRIPFSKFKVDGFIPREEFQKKAYSILEDIIGRIPGDANFTAECKKMYGKFHFKIVVNGSNVNFEANTVLDPRNEDSSKRNWLNKAIDGLHNSMNMQINDWLQSRSLDV